MSNIIKDDRYLKFLEIILEKIQIARIEASQKVNFATMELYYSIGNLVVEKIKNEYGWGNSVVEQLSKDLPDKLKGKLPSAIELSKHLKDKYGF
jgi:hypothetical protein